MKIFGILLLGLIITLTGYLVLSKKTIIPNTPSSSSTPVSTLQGKPELSLETLFDLKSKKTGTKIYYSEKLGVGFTYLPHSPEDKIEITEKDNMIKLNDQSIEVFTKEANLSFEDAIKTRFLKNYSSIDCFVKPASESEQKTQNYLATTISYPKPDNPEAPFWENADKCPPNYTESNGLAYFLMNKNVATKYLYVSIGQYSAASDGTETNSDQRFNWSQAIKILE